jgi:hypothetical protein
MEAALGRCLESPEQFVHDGAIAALILASMGLIIAYLVGGSHSGSSTRPGRGTTNRQGRAQIAEPITNSQIQVDLAKIRQIDIFYDPEDRLKK